MAKVLLLLPGDGLEVSLGPTALDGLRRLGVTNVALLRDEASVALVLEGWAFDPASSADDALGVVAESGRVLLPLTEMAVSPARP